ncbi:hypothetical protein C8R45DRAFT_939802 [Mycena sanguinolenta]|nr:hypothetical protein C8R45DRAFT_939802 [Mycena sanguinolenta]
MTNSEGLSAFTTVQLFPILRNLNLVYIEDYGDDEGHTQLFGIHDAPALRHFSLECVLPSTMIMPWARLTKMTLSLPLWEFLNALRWATSLHGFGRQGASEQGDQSTSKELPVRHSSLISLAISTSVEDEDILPHLTLPRLQRLELGGRFKVYAPYLDDETVPFLSRVSAYDTGARPPNGLTIPNGCHPYFEPDFLPKLQSFLFLDCGSDQVDDELLDAAVLAVQESRILIGDVVDGAIHKNCSAQCRLQQHDYRSCSTGIISSLGIFVRKDY